jgi:V8-like Glu-specific endopeptidase
MVKKIAAVLVFAALTVVPAGAITGGQPDGNDHPYGALILVPGQGFCSGTLIDEDVVLTAGHCTDFFDTENQRSLDHLRSRGGGGQGDVAAH